MDWRLQVAVQTVLIRLPLRDALRRWKRRHFGYRLDTANLGGTLHDFDRMSQALGALGRSFAGSRVLEVGSGWFPAIPIMLVLRGARLVTMSDLKAHMDEDTFRAALAYLKEALSAETQLARITRLADLPIRYLVPFEPTAIESGSIDYVLSRAVLEHVPPHDLESLLAALRPKLAPDALMLHVVDHSDHLEHGDKSISKINFLTWTERKHALINALMKGGENRLRHHQYLGLFERAGFRVVSAETEIHEHTRNIANTLKLAPPYSAMSADEVAALTSVYVLAPARSTTL